MTSVPAVNLVRPNVRPATYNAVKIQINNPQVNIPEDFKSNNNGDYNAVALQINKPEVNAGDKCPHKIYNYPQAKHPIDAKTACFCPECTQLPVLPVAYQTNYVNNRTMINADLGVAQNLPKNEPVEPAENVVIVEEIVEVPAPNLITVEEEKNNFLENSNKLNFRGSDVKIAPSVEIKPSVDVKKIVRNLSGNDFDKQALQMEEIAKISMTNPKNAIPYIVTEIFSELINIVGKDTSNLTPPTEKQIETRKQIIVNEIIKEQAKEKGEDPKSVELPYSINEQDFAEAVKLSKMEEAERNKEYALYTMAILAKVYTDEVQNYTGSVVPLTDLPGVSDIVNALRKSKNTGVKIAAIDALRYLNRPEYSKDISSILEIAANEKDPLVARAAAAALNTIK